MRVIVLSLVLFFILQEVVGPPVTQKKPEDEKNEGNTVNETARPDLGDAVEYNRYLKEVVSALESDPEFREKLEKAEEVDIRTGKIAHELEYVNHHVRNKLDELKRQELERLRHFASKEYELRNDIDTEHLKITPEHLDHANPNTFEIEDLRKLIAKTSADLAEVDKQRREEFKQYEMQKEFEKHEKLKNLDDEHKKAMEHEFEEKEQKHKKHEPLHHPGSKQQLEEVWDKQDHMENQDFDPRTFFHLHDLDGNGVWDESEVKSLFLKELDKLYQSGAPEDDMRERAEEMERMREHVFKEADVNRDGLISYQEFLAQTQKPEFEKDEGWEGLDQQQIYTQNEYDEFERRRQEEVQRMIAQGLIPPHPNAGYQQGMPNQQQHYPGQPGQVPQYQGQQGSYHPNQVPQYQGGHGQQAQYHPNQVPQGQFHPGQVPQGQFHPGQVPQGQLHPGQVPQGQLHPGQVPQGQVPQGQFHPGQVPQGQLHPGQVPQGQVPQGQLHPGQVSQGQVHQGRVPPSQLNPGQVAQGNIPQGQVPQGHHPGQVQQGQVNANPAVQGQAQVPQSHAQAPQQPQKADDPNKANSAEAIKAVPILQQPVQPLPVASQEVKHSAEKLQ